MSMQELAIVQGHYGMAEEILNDAILDALRVKDYSYLIKSCTALANLYKYEDRIQESIGVYEYLDSKIPLNDKTYEIK